MNGRELWNWVTQEADRKGSVTISRNVLKDLWRDHPAQDQLDRANDRIATLERMLAACIANREADDA